MVLEEVQCLNRQVLLILPSAAADQQAPSHSIIDHVSIAYIYCSIAPLNVKAVYMHQSGRVTMQQLNEQHLTPV